MVDTFTGTAYLSLSNKLLADFCILHFPQVWTNKQMLAS